MEPTSDSNNEKKNALMLKDLAERSKQALDQENQTDKTYDRA